MKKAADLATFRRSVLRMTQSYLAETIGEDKNTIARKERGDLEWRRERVFALLGVHSVLNAGESPDELYAAALERLDSLTKRAH